MDWNSGQEYTPLQPFIAAIDKHWLLIYPALFTIQAFRDRRVRLIIKAWVQIPIQPGVEVHLLTSASFSLEPALRVVKQKVKSLIFTFESSNAFIQSSIRHTCMHKHTTKTIQQHLEL